MRFGPDQVWQWESECWSFEVWIGANLCQLVSQDKMSAFQEISNHEGTKKSNRFVELEIADERYRTWEGRSPPLSRLSHNSRQLDCSKVAACISTQVQMSYGAHAYSSFFLLVGLTLPPRPCRAACLQCGWRSPPAGWDWLSTFGPFWPQSSSPTGISAEQYFFLTWGCVRMYSTWEWHGATSLHNIRVLAVNIVYYRINGWSVCVICMFPFQQIYSCVRFHYDRRCISWSLFTGAKLSSYLYILVFLKGRHKHPPETKGDGAGPFNSPFTFLI